MIDLPALADDRGWPIGLAQEFEQLVLDTICKAPWQQKVAAPPTQFLRNAQLRKAVYLAEDLVTGTTALEPLYQQSLGWRQ